MLIVGAVAMILPGYQSVVIGLVLILVSLIWQWLQIRKDGESVTGIMHEENVRYGKD